jgi:bacteriorhodopsin
MWFEIAVIAILLLFGHIAFGHFEEKTPRWRKLLKAVLTIAVFSLISYFFGSFWFWIALIIALIPPLVIHVWWLPKQGINGWTGEPKDKYYELRGWKIDENS